MRMQTCRMHRATLTDIRRIPEVVSMLRRLMILAAVVAGLAGGTGIAQAKPVARPNILFVVMDDVGVDQMSLLGYGGVGAGPLAPPRTPSLDALARGGVLFRNTWATPECSPSRASFFTGRYPLRTNVMAALLPSDLAASQTSPFETTTPSILRSVGYRSALFGKFHLTNSPTHPQTPSTDPYNGTPVTQLGWDYFKGWYDGGPSAIDTTAGGIAGTGTYPCGYVPSRAIDRTNGADSGACYKADASCTYLSGGTPGQTCIASGGILKPHEACGAMPAELKFDQENGYYVGQMAENPGPGRPAVLKPPQDPASRGYRTTLDADFAIQWIKQQPSGTPWMTTLAFGAAHTPYQPAPPSLVNTKSTLLANDCSDSAADSRALMTQMVEALDTELGRVLVETGIATRNPNGSINYDPQKSNTMIVVVGDNGSYANNVRLPFDPAHSKGTVYQTGVWVPLIVAGPIVAKPNRAVESMVNIVDLFQLFGDVAGVDVRKAVPPTHGLDSQAMLPYLVNPQQDAAPIRKTNFTQYGENARSISHVDGTCVIQSVNTCTTLFPTKELCEDGYGGIWYGAGTTVDLPEPYKSGNGLVSCCQVNQYLHSINAPLVALLPANSYAVRNKDYKLIRQTVVNYDPAHPDLGDQCLSVTTDEFYKVNQARTAPRLDHPDGQFANNYLAPGTGPGAGTSQLSGVLKANYDALVQSLADTLNSYKACPGDANLDAKVNIQDLADQARWMRVTKGTSTWWDMNSDGYTNGTDRSTLAGLITSEVCSLLPGQSR